jgi:proteic killer suppression protein
MEVDYKDKKLALLETDQAHQTKLPPAVIASYRRKVVQLKAAPDERTLRNIKSLHFEKLKGNPEDHRSIRLNDAWRVILTIDESVSPHRLVIIDINNHYE